MCVRHNSFICLIRILTRVPRGLFCRPKFAAPCQGSGATMSRSSTASPTNRRKIRQQRLYHERLSTPAPTCCGALQCVAVCCRHTDTKTEGRTDRLVRLNTPAPVCCTVVQGVAVCCRVLQGGAGCCRVVQGVAGCCRVLQGVAECGRMLRCVAVCVAVCCIADIKTQRQRDRQTDSSD